MIKELLYYYIGVQEPFGMHFKQKASIVFEWCNLVLGAHQLHGRLFLDETPNLHSK